MIVELRGVGFVNKGAELMLHAMMDKVKSNYPDVVFAMEVNKASPLKKIWSLGIKAKTNVTIKRVPLNGIFGLLPAEIRSKLGWVMEHEIQVILDGSGFNYGDKWGAKRAGDRLADHLPRWKAAGKKVILLPQAFGPFTKADLIKRMGIILNESDLIFARDRISLEFIQQIAKNHHQNKIHLAPDFTNLKAPVWPESKNQYANMLAIIPNQKMLETGNNALNQNYPEFLKHLIELAINRGQRPFFLIHESKHDKAIAAMVNSQLSKPIQIVEEEDPLVVKGIIGSCFAVITSRFHGLVSALSQSIPCLATGWSHKYEMLFEDYGYPEGLCQLQEDMVYYEGKLDLIVKEDLRIELIKKLNTASNKQKQLSNDMWQLVFNNINELV